MKTKKAPKRASKNPSPVAALRRELAALKVRECSERLEKETAQRLLKESEAELTKFREQIDDLQVEVNGFRRLVQTARNTLGGSPGLSATEVEYVSPTKLIQRLAAHAANEIELSETPVGYTRENRALLARFRELAREAHTEFNRPGSYLSPEDSGYMERLAALHKEE